MKIGDKIPNQSGVNAVIEDIVTGISENRGRPVTLVMICRNGVEKWVEIDKTNG